jgi:hypothetical protein
VPQFDAGNPAHTRLAALSQQAHRLTAGQPPEGSEPSGGLAAIEAQVDKVAQL